MYLLIIIKMDSNDTANVYLNWLEVYVPAYHMINVLYRLYETLWKTSKFSNTEAIPSLNEIYST